MYELESAIENTTHKIFWNIKIQTDPQIPAWKPDQVLKLIIWRTFLFQKTTEGKWN